MERLQPERVFEPNPDAEDEAYDRMRQRELDEEQAHAETLLRQQQIEEIQK